MALAFRLDDKRGVAGRTRLARADLLADNDEFADELQLFLELRSHQRVGRGRDLNLFVVALHSTDLAAVEERLCCHVEFVAGGLGVGGEPVADQDDFLEIPLDEHRLPSGDIIDDCVRARRARRGLAHHDEAAQHRHEEADHGCEPGLDAVVVEPMATPASWRSCER
jgi:hypothetical protein